MVFACSGDISDGSLDATQAGVKLKHCGDGECRGHESCDNCPSDCGMCVDPDAWVEPDPEPDASVSEPDASVSEPDASVSEPDASVSEPDASTEEPNPPAVSDGIWVSPGVLASLPTSGTAWDNLLSAANDLDPSGANVSDQDSHHDQYTLAAALVCARTGDATLCQRAQAALVNAIDTESGGRWLAVGRNVGAYAIAADLLNLRADGDPNSDGSRVEAWLARFLTRTLSHNNDSSQQITLRESAWASGSNASAQEGFIHVAIAAYLGDQSELDWAWGRYRRHVCDLGAPDPSGIDLSKGVAYGWAHDDQNPCAINPKGTQKQGVRIDGAIINDMRRGGEFQVYPGYTQYPWVGLEGLVPAAVILHRAGYPAFSIADTAVKRTYDYLWFLRNHTGNVDWFDGMRASETTQLVNVAYGTSFIATRADRRGRTVGFTAWSHANSL